MEKKQNPTQQQHTFTNQKKYTTTQNKHKKVKPGLVASYDIWPGNGQDLFWFQRFINLSPTYLLLLIYSQLRTHTGLVRPANHSFWGPRPPLHRWGEICHEVDDKFHPHWCNVSLLWGEKPQNFRSNLNTGVCAVGILPAIQLPLPIV